MWKNIKWFLEYCTRTKLTDYWHAEIIVIIPIAIPMLIYWVWSTQHIIHLLEAIAAK